MQSVAAIKAAVAAKDKQEKKPGKKETKWRTATEEGLGDVGLEEAMEDTETDQTTMATKRQLRQLLHPRCKLRWRYMQNHTASRLSQEGNAAAQDRRKRKRWRNS